MAKQLFTKRTTKDLEAKKQELINVLISLNLSFLNESIHSLQKQKFADDNSQNRYFTRLIFNLTQQYPVLMTQNALQTFARNEIGEVDATKKETLTKQPRAKR